MKNLIFAAALLLLTTRVAHGDFKSYGLANYGSPFTYVPTTADDLTSALNGGPVKSGGYPTGTLAELFQDGPTSLSDSYDPGVGLHVSFSASTAFRPAEPLSTAAPGIGANVSAENTAYIGSSTVIGESYAYLKKTVLVNNFSMYDHLIKSYGMTLSLDGAIHVSGDAIAQVGEAIRISLEHGTPTVTSNIQTFQPGFGGLLNDYHFGQPGHFGDPIKLTHPGVYGAEIIAQKSSSVTIETLLYVRAQTGITDRAAGTASADFSSTLRVSNIQFFDENDQVIPGLQVVSSDGDVYPYNVVPEPSMLALFGVGSSGLLFARFRRTQRS